MFQRTLIASTLSAALVTFAYQGFGQSREMQITGSSSSRVKTSAEWRAEKKYALGLKGGFGFVTVPSGGIWGSYMINPGFGVALGYEGGAIDLTEAVEDQVDYDLSKAALGATQLQLGLEFFLSNSFWISPFLSQRNVVIDVAADNRYGFEESATSKHNSLVLGVDVGNRWILDNGITIGARWFGVNKSLTSSQSTSYRSAMKKYGFRLDNTEEEIRKSENEIADILDSPLFSLPQLTIGYQF